MRTEDGDLATCELCFIEATTEEIVACEIDPAFSAVEERSNAEYDERAGRQGQTLVAYALREAAEQNRHERSPWSIIRE